MHSEHKTHFIQWERWTHMTENRDLVSCASLSVLVVLSRPVHASSPDLLLCFAPDEPSCSVHTEMVKTTTTKEWCSLKCLDLTVCFKHSVNQTKKAISTLSCRCHDYSRGGNIASLVFCCVLQLKDSPYSKSVWRSEQELSTPLHRPSAPQYTLSPMDRNMKVSCQSYMWQHSSRQEELNMN